MINLVNNTIYPKLNLIITKILNNYKLLAGLMLALGIFGLLYQFTIFPNYKPIHSDGVGYYYYLPATLIYGNAAVAQPIIDGDVVLKDEQIVSYGITKYQATDRYINKYPIGVAISLAPFFIVAHLLAPLLGQLQTGYSPVYHHLAMLGAIVYVVLGCLVLRKLLKRYVSTKIASATILAVFLGTNLYYYVTFDAIFSHALSFALIATFAYMVLKWHDNPSLKYTMILGVVYGAILTTRQANALVILLWPLYGIDSLAAVTKQIKLFFRHKFLLIAFVIPVLVGFSPQMLYWYAVTGSPILYSYGGEGFNFLRPRILQILLWPSRNMFYWFPINLLGFLGIWVLSTNNLFRFNNRNWQSKIAKARKWLLAVGLVLILQVYIISSWWIWTFGGGVGHRALLDFLPLWSIFIAVAFSYLWQYQKRRWLIVIIVILSIIFSQLVILEGLYKQPYPPLPEVLETRLKQEAFSLLDRLF